ncbi:hypothetical protein VZO05_01250 [Aggregatilineales bacterium SYSU G02658]
MSLEQQIADAIVLAFDDLGGNPLDAVRKALYHRKVADFVQDETTKVALAGGAEMAIPGIQVLTIPVGISYLLHKMAVITWGVGALKGAYVIETPRYSDLRNVLSVYANDSLYNGAILTHQPIHRDTFGYALSDTGYQTLLTLTANSDRADIQGRTWRMLRQLSEEYAVDERAYQLYRMVAGAAAADAAQASAAGRYLTDATPPDPIERRIGGKLALKLAARISARVPARFVMGFVPIAGAIINAFFNAQTLREFASAAEAYYDQLLLPDHIEKATVN